MGGVFGGQKKTRRTHIVQPVLGNQDQAPLLGIQPGSGKDGRSSLGGPSCAQPFDRHIRKVGPESYAKVGPESYAKMDHQRNFSEIYDHDVLASATKKFDFQAFGVVSNGWEISTMKLPEAFLFAGGSAIVIEREDEDINGVTSKELRVLVALPEVAVDITRAKWLSRRPGFAEEAVFLSHLCRIRDCKANGSVVLEFDYPRGESLADLLEQKQQLSEPQVRSLVLNLTKIVVFAANSPLRLFGFLDPSMVFLNEQKELEKIIPFGCLLSYSGAKAAVYQAVENSSDWALAPEVKRAVFTNDRTLEKDVDIAGITDAFAISVLALRALGQQKVDDNRGVEVELPDLAQDMLKKTLHGDPEWRLSAKASLSHPWISQDT